MPSNGEVVIIVAGEDQSGAVMQAVEANLARVQARAQSAGRAMQQSGEHAVPAMAAASASVRVLDGDFSHLLRAEERFLASLPGVSALMQKAFPVIGILAVAEGLYRMGSAAYDALQKANGMASAIRVGFGDANLEVAKANDTLRVSNDRLEMSIAKLEKKPGNGLKLALDEARESADNLALSLVKDNQRVSEYMSKYTIGAVSGFFTNQQSTGDAEKLQKEYSTASRQIVFAGQEKERVAKTADEAQGIRTQTQNQLYSLQSKTLDQISGRLKALNAERAKDNAYADTHMTLLPGKRRGGDESDLQGLFSSISQQQDTVKLTASNDDLQREKEVAAAKHEQLETARTEAREAEEERRKEEEWLTRIQKAGIGPGRVAETNRQGIVAKMLDQSHREVAESTQDDIESVGKQWEKDAEEAVKSSERQIQAFREVQEARIKGANEQYRSTDQDTQFAVKTGSMSENQRFAALRSAAQDEYAVRRNALEQLKELDSINPDDPQKVQRDLDEITELQTQYSRQMVTLTQQQVEAQRSATEGYVRSILNPLMSGTETVSKRFKQMADNIVSELERIAENKAINAITDALMGGKGKGGAAATPGQSPMSGIGASVEGLLGKLFGRKKGDGGVASNGGLATGAGTTPSSVTGQLQQGGGNGGAGGVVVNLINQGTAQQAVSSGSTGGGLEQQVISIVLKDADSLGPMSKAIGGAIGMY